MNLLKNITLATAMLVTVPMAVTAPVMAQEYPLVAGDYTSMSGIYVKDGGTLAYAKHLASIWMKGQEFAKSKGWISDYKIFVNVDARDGEPNIYLTSTFPSIPGGAEIEKRNKEWMEWSKKTDAQLDAEAGDRAEYRTQKGSMLLQEYTIR